MNIEKLQKFHALATNNPNKNEAALAALKFLEEVEKNKLNIFLHTPDNQPFTKEKVQEILNKECQKAYQQGFNEAVRRIREEQQEIQRQKSMANTQQRFHTGTATTNGSLLYFNGRRV
tara:strand:- start:614 stop:967 length:354 start_codon:yes stop_codon:yes gene_type:complete